MKPSVLILLMLCNLVPTAARGQTAYLSGAAGVSAGDGGAAPAIALAAGYITPRRIGFEVDFGYTPELDTGEPEVVILDSFPGLFPGPTIFPPITFEGSGRLFTLHTNVIFSLASTGKIRVIASGGGGVANFERRLRIHQEPFPFPFPEPFPFPIPSLDREVTSSETGLSLNLGGTVEYLWTERLGVGLDARYNHIFLERTGLDLARITGRVTWRF